MFYLLKLGFNNFLSNKFVYKRIKMKKTLFILLIFISFSKLSHSQTTTDVQNKGGFIILETKTELTTSDFQKISNYNFDEYRFYNLRKKIQLKQGPLIELKSISELQQEGVVLSQTVIEIARAKSENFKHESILLLDLGLGINIANEPK